MSLVRSGSPEHDAAESQRTKLAELEAALNERAAEIDRTRTDLAGFRIRYRHEVGRLHEELDELQRAIAEAELVEIAKKLDAEPGQSTASSTGPQAEAQARFTSDAVRKLFRDVAKMIHPDLADDDSTRDRRHRLMVEANCAYALGDEERLRWILDTWARSPEAVPGSDPDAIRERLNRRIAEVEERLHACAADLAALRESPMWQLKAMVDEASAQGKDLIAEMVRRLTRDILVERNRLEAIRWRPSSSSDRT